ncbi:hypothetical protein [Ectobacillus ponti]|uniref:Uncharacterized protein n=1 Tax=Ectobacillus ponti TaxID=2961894 RepID=A0AA41X758_9BACI|nr:hypothetical protein [Ectobacillus ponti]MCP8968433.1 hypothetical protein [Ectobacillus ponti]
MAIVLAALSVILAMKGSGYWIVLVVLATILTFLSANRADKIQKTKG